MIPNQKWFPTSLSERATWFDNFNAQFQILATTLGFDAGDKSAFANDNEVIQFLATTTVAVEGYADAIRHYRKIMTEGVNGASVPAFPGDPSFSLPVTLPTGIFERLDDFVKRIRVAPNYTDEIGALLGILTGTQPIAPIGSTPPVIKATAQPGNLIEVSFVRGHSSGVLLQTQIDNEGTFADAGRFFRSPAELSIPPGDKPLPRSVEIRARFLDGNTPLGSWSQVETIATIP